ncbi:hypothetical protein EOI86_21190 [Hwanghaeella grinnelliae]|uniref:EF-hand domain-containing protein n=1 Tax=Hwanghaeella grinnelliae TaxID=2500179 RepID=A0A3S2VM52_9PROT|nr:EF-hand domain-containing protein [Hwanghaeella grinnelliae]RVU33673.1 hypothetical protein EOI86_21190 [Hwanghaeella grinnelliae]
MENNENTGSTDNNDKSSARRHKGRGAMWMVVLAGTAAALGTAAFVGHAVASGNGYQGCHRGGHERGFGGHHGGPRGEMIFRTFDTDKDGTVTAAEINAETERRMSGNDANGDGALSLEEFQGVWMEMLRNRMVDAFQRFDDDGDGVITKAEVDEKTSWMMSRMDRDGDGKITREEQRPRFRRDDDRFEGPEDDD